MLGIIGAPGWVEVCIFGLIILLLFGKRLPSAMRSLGGSIKSFKSGYNEAQNDDKEDDKSGNSTE